MVEYSISIDNVRYDFVTTVATSVANAAAYIGNGLVAAINAGTNNFDASLQVMQFKLKLGPLDSQVIHLLLLQLHL